MAKVGWGVLVGLVILGMGTFTKAYAGIGMGEINPLQADVQALMVYISFPDADSTLPSYYAEVANTLEHYFRTVSYGKHKVHIRTALRPSPHEGTCYVTDSTSAFYRSLPHSAGERLGRLHKDIFSKMLADNPQVFDRVDVVFSVVKVSILTVGATATLGDVSPTLFSGPGFTCTLSGKGGLLNATVHEYGHNLGLDHPPSERLGKYSPMRGGGFGPYAVEHLVQLGWIDSTRIVEVKSNRLNERIKDIRKDGKLYKIPISDDEYFWVSNHQGTDYDAHYSEKGLLIWHIKKGSIWDVESADGMFGEDRSADPIAGKDWIDRGSGDPRDDFFDGVRKTAFSVNTNPNTNGYSGSFGSPPQFVYTGISIENIRRKGEDILADFVRYEVWDHDVMVQSIVWPVADTTMLSTVITPTVMVRNVGKNVEDTFTVELEIEREGEVLFHWTYPIAYLGSMDTVRVAFPMWKVEEEGIYDFTFETRLSGDENPKNDVLAHEVAVRKEEEEEEKLYTDVTEWVGLGDLTSSGFGAVFGDVDKDGDLDLYVVCSVSSNVLYVHNEDGTFRDGTDAVGLREEGFGRDAVLGDVDNDGDLDLYVVNDHQPNVLYLNHGDGTFTDATAFAGVGDSGTGRNVVLGDYDGDGYLDIYVVNSNQPNVLYRNNGDGTFSDVTVAAGVGDAGNGSSAVWFDYDLDNDVDLYVTNEGMLGLPQPNLLYRNNGDGTFTDVGVSAGVAYRYEGPEDWKISYAAAVGDYDNDSDLDLYVLRHWGLSNSMLLNNRGNGHFVYANDLARLWGADFPGGDAVFGDYDNDGDLDLYVAWNSSPWEKVFMNALFENTGDGAFYQMYRWYESKGGERVLSSSFVKGGEQVGWATIVGLGYRGNCRRVIFVDYDGDGDLDAYLRTASGQVLYRNNGPEGHWLEVNVIGTKTNRDGIGAKVWVVAGDLTQLREIHSESGLVAHFGLGKRARIDTLEMIWPSGKVDVMTDLEADQRITIREGSGVVTSVEGGRAQRIPQSFSLSQNVPNPFNASTTIWYALPEASRVEVAIFDVLGRKVRTLVSGGESAGAHRVVWDGTEADGRAVGSGVYLCSARAGDFSAVRRMVLLR